MKRRRSISLLSLCFAVVSPDVSAATASTEMNVPFQLETAVMGESSIVDKETGRIFWESSKQATLSQNLAPLLRSITGIPHLKASILSTILWFELMSTLAGLGRGQLQKLARGQTLSQEHTFFLSSVQSLLLLPRVPRWLLALTVFLALTEAAFCSTRQYLSHRVTNVESCLETLRRTPVVVDWRVRAYHYQKWLGGLLQRKVVSNTATGQYHPAFWEDETVAGLWKRAMPSARDSIAPFTKITLSKTLLLRDTRARQDYLQQQRSFVQSAAMDEHAEFSTKISIAGFEPRLLVVRNRPWFFTLPVFWFFTLCGLTVPFRRWFSAHCDELRVAVVKEVGTTPVKKSIGWFASKQDEARLPIEAQLYRSENHQNATAALVEEGLQAVNILSKLPAMAEPQINMKKIASTDEYGGSS